MRKYKEIFHKKTKQVELRFFTLNKLNNEENLSKFLSIIDIFELNTADFTGSCFVFGEENLADELSNIDTNIVLRTKEVKQRLPYEVSFQFRGDQINSIIRLLAKKNIPLYINTTNEKNEISKIEILSNDREFSAITFIKDIFNHDTIISKIEVVLN